MISRYVVIALAFGVAIYRMYEGAWIEAAGLLGLGGGLVCLKLGERQPAYRRFAWVGFAVTALAIVSLILRTRTVA